MREPEVVRAVDDVSVRVRARSTLGLVGESGSGKTTLARLIVGLETADRGEMELLDLPLNLDLKQRPREALRDLQMVFQNPNDTLNPYLTIGQQIARTIHRLNNEKLTKAQIDARVIELLNAVRLTVEVRHALSCRIERRRETACRHRPRLRHQSRADRRRRANLLA